MADDSLSSILLTAVVLLGSIAILGMVAFAVNVRTVAALSVESAEAQTSPLEAVVAISVKNTGGKQLKMVALKVQVEGCDIAYFNVDVPPGGSCPIVLRNPPGKWAPGETKSAAVTAIFADGSEASTVASIRVHGSGWCGVEANPETPSGGGVGGSVGESGEGVGGSVGESGGGGGVIFVDDFKNGLSGWRPWGSASGVTVEVDKHGKPSPCLHVHVPGQASSVAGAAKTVSVDLSSPAVLCFAFDYNVHALKDGGVFPGNLWVMVLGPSGDVLVDERVYAAGSADSGWKYASVTIPPVTGRLELIIYMHVQSSKGQEFWVDNVTLRTA